MTAGIKISIHSTGHSFFAVIQIFNDYLLGKAEVLQILKNHRTCNYSKNDLYKSGFTTLH